MHFGHCRNSVIERVKSFPRDWHESAEIGISSVSRTFSGNLRQLYGFGLSDISDKLIPVISLEICANYGFGLSDISDKLGRIQGGRSYDPDTSLHTFHM